MLKLESILVAKDRTLEICNWIKGKGKEFLEVGVDGSFETSGVFKFNFGGFPEERETRGSKDRIMVA
jgi:hypothetical protein